MPRTSPSIGLCFACLTLLGIFAPFGRADQTQLGPFAALKYSSTSNQSTWAVVAYDGARRETEPYLSSLAGGESATGVIASPPFDLSVDTITFTLRGHDGQGGGQDMNVLLLLDAKTGDILRKTAAPGDDSLQALAWDVADLQGRRVRVEARDGLALTAYAWLGVGRIDAGEELAVDFSDGLPSDWQTAVVSPEAEPIDHLDGPIPFRSYSRQYTLIPERGTTTIPCQFAAKRLYMLGCTVPAAKVCREYGRIEVAYFDGTKESYPLVFGFTLEGACKAPSATDTCYVRPIGDQTQYFLVIRPATKTIRAIHLSRASPDLPRPRITAITCEGPSWNAKTLDPLPATNIPEGENAWIDAHSLSADGPTLEEIGDAIRRARGVPLSLEEQLRQEARPRLQFDREKISNRSFEAASVCDVDADGHKDIVSGGYWYAGPSFATEHKITHVPPAGEYWDDFSDYPMDVNGDGRIDIVTGAFFGGPLRWLENPGRNDQLWEVHPIDDVGPIETTRFWDVDGDGYVEIVPNAGGNVVFFRLERDAEGRGTGHFEKYIVKRGGCGHGLGFGDVNGDGRGDFLTPASWIEAPDDPLAGVWAVHDDAPRLDQPSVPILLHDVNEDGLNDLIVGQAHGHGIAWYEQQISPQQGTRSWTRHAIDEDASQYHDMALADIDRDGQAELITGKRYRAHNGHDPGATDPLFVRYFDIEGGRFVQHTIDYGPADTASGVGIYFWVEDVDRNGWLDIVAPGKEGLYLFRNHGRVSR